MSEVSIVVLSSICKIKEFAVAKEQLLPKTNCPTKTIL